MRDILQLVKMLFVLVPIVIFFVGCIRIGIKRNQRFDTENSITVEGIIEDFLLISISAPFSSGKRNHVQTIGYPAAVIAFRDQKGTSLTHIHDTVIGANSFLGVMSNYDCRKEKLMPRIGAKVTINYLPDYCYLDQMANYQGARMEYDEWIKLARNSGDKTRDICSLKYGANVPNYGMTILSLENSRIRF